MTLVFLLFYLQCEVIAGIVITFLCAHRLVTPECTPRGWIFQYFFRLPHGQLCTIFREVQAGYVSVVATDINTMILVSVTLKSEHDFVHAHLV